MFQWARMATGNRRQFAFTLVELMVVIGIISVLISLLMPAMASVRQKGNWIKCQANLNQIGTVLQIYVNENKGWYFPPNLGADKPPEKRWPMYVFKPPTWNPPCMLCPTDEMPAEEHSYLLNDHIYVRKIKGNTTDLGNKSSSEVILMGEKRSDYADYYMNVADYPTRVEPYRHGIQIGSNYLFLDSHVATLQKAQAIVGMDPWDVPEKPPTPP